MFFFQTTDIKMLFLKYQNTIEISTYVNWRACCASGGAAAPSVPLVLKAFYLIHESEFWTCLDWNCFQEVNFNYNQLNRKEIKWWIQITLWLKGCTSFVKLKTNERMKWHVLYCFWFFVVVFLFSKLGLNFINDLIYADGQMNWNQGPALARRPADDDLWFVAYPIKYLCYKEN